jgi:uncharacterized membrane protein HdeD (DUF308 family)
MSATTAAQSDKPKMPGWLIVIEGFCLVIMGFMLLASPGMTITIIVQILGLYWLIAGILRIVSIFIDKSMWGWKLFAGILGIIAGIIVVQHPLWSTVILGSTLVLVVGIGGIAYGIIRLIQAFQGAGLGAGVLGVVSIIIGIVLLANVWGVTTSLPYILGIVSIFGGIAAVAIGTRT